MRVNNYLRTNIFKSFFKAIYIIFKTIFMFIYSIRFLYTIPLLSIAALAFSLPIILLIGPFIRMLPEALDIGFVESAIAATIFIILKYKLFNNKLYNDINFNYRKDLIYFASTIVLWSIPAMIFTIEGGMAWEFLVGANPYNPDFSMTFLKIGGLIYFIFYFPHLWLTTITQEFAFSIALGLILNGAIFLLLAYFAIKDSYTYEDSILNSIKKISPGGEEYVNTHIKRNQVEIFTDNNGVFLKAETDETCIFFAIFDEEESELEKIELITRRHLKLLKQKKVYFNVYGDNQKIIALVQSIGFKLQIEGYHMQFDGKLYEYEEALTEKPYSDRIIDLYINLFELAYYQLNKDNNWPTDYYRQNKINFDKKLQYHAANNQFYSYWLKDKLVGAFIFEDNYITDLVVVPEFQSKGYGEYILFQCLQKMRRSTKLPIRLRLAKSNQGAKRFYTKHHFIVISKFAEHIFDEK